MNAYIINVLRNCYTHSQKGRYYMLRPTAAQVAPLENYILRIVFDNGEIKFFDVKPYITGDWYGELSDPAYFCSVSVNGYSVEWSNGQDLCPDDLYYNSVVCLNASND